MVRRTVAVTVIGILLAGSGADLARGAYVVWTCYGGTWSASATTPTLSKAQYYEREFQKYGLPTAITTGNYPTKTCSKPAQNCLYYAKLSYNGQYGYLGGYTSVSAAERAGRQWVLSIGRGAAYHGVFRACS